MFADKAGQKIFGSGSSRPLSITVVHENQNSFNRQNTGNNRKKDKFSLEWLLPVIITGRILQMRSALSITEPLTVEETRGPRKHFTNKKTYRSRLSYKKSHISYHMESGTFRQRTSTGSTLLAEHPQLFNKHRRNKIVSRQRADRADKNQQPHTHEHGDIRDDIGCKG